jgi:hypothetical protein
MAQLVLAKQARGSDVGLGGVMRSLVAYDQGATERRSTSTSRQ